MTYTHDYERTHPDCTCVYGTPPIKLTCPTHGHLARSADARSANTKASMLAADTAES